MQKHLGRQALWCLWVMITLSTSLPGSQHTVKAAPAAPTAFQTSLSLNGSSDYVEIPHNAALSPQTALTLEAWTQRSRTTAGCEAIVGKDYQSGYWLGLCNDRIRYHSGGAASSQDATTVIPANVWTHIAVVWDSAGNTRRYYINGALEYTGSAGSAPGGSARLRIGDDTPFDFFSGNIAEVRLWNVARSQDDIRRTMHTFVDERLPGLVAAWHLSDDYSDSIGGFNGTSGGGASLSGPQAPPRPASVPIDKNFNTLPVKRYGAATVYLPRGNRAMLIGGIVNGGISLEVDLVDVSSGASKSLGILPAKRAWAAAAYAPNQNTVYVFGGSADFNATTFTNTIYAIDPNSGASRTVATTLPVAAFGVTAVYHPGRDKIYLFGGFSGNTLNTVSVFDPMSETLSPLTLALPGPRYQMGGVWAAASDQIHLFAGLVNPLTSTNTIFAVSLSSDGLTGTITPLAATLPQADYSVAAVEDARTRLIYVLGGAATDRVLAFDPLTGDLWRTLVQLPQARPNAGVVYSNLNRHALLMGGGYFQSMGEQNMWRIPLGDGPAVPLGRWDFPTPVGAGVNAISGGGKRVFVATQGEGFWRYDETGLRYQFPPQWLGSANGIVNDIYYAPLLNEAWIATSDAGGKVYAGGAIVTYDTGYVTNPVLGVDYNFFGHAGGLAWNSAVGWKNNFSSNFIKAMAPRPGAFFSTFQEWVLAGTGSPSRPPDINPGQTLSPSAPAAATYDLRRLSYNYLNGSASETNFGAPCGDSGGNDIAFDANRNWWIPAGAGVCFIPAATTPGAGNLLQPLVGGAGRQVSVDADGRVWVTFIGNVANSSGGLVAYQPVTSPLGLRTAEFNWLSGPVGTKFYYSGNWQSSLNAVGAVDERVWTGRSDGQLFTLAQRWQQLDQSDDLGNKVIEGVWLARGRAFLATNNSLHVLMPDGKTWDNRTGVHVRAVLGDSRGRVWVGTDGDVRLYTPAGWDTMPTTVGTPPSGPVTALAEDQSGRIWIGGANGLTLYDRNRFVFTLNSANSPLPSNNVQALMVDKDNRLWVGTSNGLAQLDGSGWTVFGSASGLPSTSIHALAQTGDGTIAVSTDNGLAFYTSTTFITETLPIAANNLPLSVDDLGRLWAGSAVRTASGWRAYYLTNSGLRSSTVSANASDNAERVWFSHAPDTGISVRGTFLPPLADTVPLITGISPDNGSAGDQITISGSGFGSDLGSVTVRIGGYPVQIVSLSDTSIVVRLTDSNLSGDVSVSVGGRRTTLVGSVRAAFCAVPRIHTVTPTGGNIGVRVDVKGSNFDPDANLTVGGGPLRKNVWRSPTKLNFMVTSGDVTGDIQVNNSCSGPTYSASQGFRVFTLNIDRVVLNQGYNAYKLITARPTMFQHYVTRNLPLYSGDRLELDAVQLTFTSNNRSRSVTIPINGTVPSTFGPPPAALLKDISNSVNVYNVQPYSGAPIDQNQTMQIQSVLMNHGLIVAQTTTTVTFASNDVLRVLLIPVMKEGFSQSDLLSMQANVNSGTADLERRLWPLGQVEFWWSDDIVTKNGKQDVGSLGDLINVSHALDRFRKWWNKSPVEGAPKVSVAFGIVHPDIAMGTATGKGLWPNASSMANILLGPLDTLCDIGGALLSIFTFGLAGGGCDLEIPMYVGWARGDQSDSSQVIGHEMGHIFSLVKLDAQNSGGLFNNATHSQNDELDGGECNSVNAFFNWNRTLYAQPGVSEPIVNPITGEQFLPQRGGNQNARRAKAIMSYACMKDNGDVFFEPPDIQEMQSKYSIYEFATKSQATLRPARDASLRITPKVVPGPRVNVSGVITKSNNTGKMNQVESLDESALLSVPYATGYWLVQLDAQGTELARLGVLPVGGAHEPNADTLYFAGTVVRQPNAARIQLRHDKVVLDQFGAGSAAPSITLSNPTGGTYNSGSVPVTWTASDADGDPLSIVVEYTSDGTRWTQVGFGSGATGTINVPVYQLGGSNTGRVRIFASDGLHTGVFTSTTFSVANQPPQPFIGGPTPITSVLEGQRLYLVGGANDKQDGKLGGSNLRWRSDRDGDLGTGSELGVMLSVGLHTLTLEAQNSKGLTASVNVSVTVVGNYVGDGIPDSVKLASGINPLDGQFAYSDADGDGLPFIMEWLRGTNPNLADSDGDGYSDAVEIAAGTDPLSSGSNPGTLPPDALVVAPRALTFTVDMSNDTPLPQAALFVASRTSVSWTLTTSASWLAASATSGSQTPDGATIHVQAFMLSDGAYTGVLTVTSLALNSVVTVPVSVNIQNSLAYCDVNRDGVTNSVDVQLVTAAVGTNNTQPGFNYRYDLNRDGRVDASDVALVSACASKGRQIYLPLVTR